MDPKLAFPTSIMAGFAGDFAAIYSQYLEPPIQFFYMACLTCLGNVLSDRITLASQIEPQPRLFTLLLGESADDRKSTAIEQTIRFFRHATADRALATCHGLGSAEGLQAKMEDVKTATGVGRLLLVFDEFRAFISKCKIEASVLLPCVTSLFESNSYESRTRAANLELKDAYLSILAASTIQTFENMWTSQFTDIGFNNRLFLVTGSGERRFSIPPAIPSADLHALRDHLGFLLSAFAGKTLMPVETSALELYDRWYRKLPSSIHSKRLDGYALRFMPLLAANEGKTAIDEQIVAKAIRLCDWQLAVRQFYDPIDADNELARMEEKIRRQLEARGPMGRHAIIRATNARRAGLHIFDLALTNLLKGQEIRTDRKLFYVGKTAS